jgi:hypothetical protein
MEKKKHACAGQLNSFAHQTALLVLHDRWADLSVAGETVRLNSLSPSRTRLSRAHQSVSSRQRVPHTHMDHGVADAIPTMTRSGQTFRISKV